MPEKALQRAGQLLSQYAVTGPPTPDGLVYFVSDRLRVMIVDTIEEVPGLLSYGDPRDYICLRKADARPRRRFTLFHELGHFLLHENITYCRAVTFEQKQYEREADRFATGMLMPSEWLYRDWADGIRQPFRLAQRYDVSQLAMKRRLAELAIR